MFYIIILSLDLLQWIHHIINNFLCYSNYYKKQLLGIGKNGIRIKIEALPNDPTLLTQLTEHKIDVTVLPMQEPSPIGNILSSLITPFIIFAGLFFLYRRSVNLGRGGGGGNNPLAFGRAKTKVQLIPDTGVNFDDVAGCDGAKIELEEVVDFLKQPDEYTKNGCKIPRGVILDGPPGTGKVRTKFFEVTVIFNNIVLNFHATSIIDFVSKSRSW